MFFKDPSSVKMPNLSPKPARAAVLVAAAFAHPCGADARFFLAPAMLPFCWFWGCL